jgi:L-lactate dehydrogenase complex protein LldF
MSSFRDAARIALGDTQLRRNLGHATATIRDKRTRVVAEVTDWEELRDAGRAIKADVMHRLDEYLLQFEASVQGAGGHVHWARDAAEANAVVLDVARSHRASEVVKVKSLTTDEIELNDALAAGGVKAIETDFAELILQLDGDWSSHILVPAIHRNRTEIRDLFLRTIAEPPLTDDPRELAEVARLYLREKFLTAKVGVSGANFAVAETGTVVPRVTDDDGPQEFHLVLLDNGRTRVLSDEIGRQALHCIRCSACLNVCPVYSRTGGHAYGSVYPGPIGAILTPQLVGVENAKSLPFASSLCGACYEVCPVKIDIPAVLLHLRAEVVRNAGSTPERTVMRSLARVFGSVRRYELAQRFARLVQRPGRRLPGPLATWTRTRELKQLPKETFREWWSRERGS